MAARTVRGARGYPMRLLALLSIVTAVMSALLDNVTTVLLMAPITLSVCRMLDVSPVPFLLAEAFASNIGGTATLIGDPPNIMIGSRAQLSFNDFVLNLAPVVAIILAIFVAMLRPLFGRIEVSEERRAAAAALPLEGLIRDRPLLNRSLAVLGATLAGFLFHGALGYEPATVALIGAAVLLIVSKKPPHAVLQQVEWTTIFFFVGLFVVIGAVVKLGLVRFLAQQALDLTAGNLLATALLILVVSAVLSAIIDNIPYVATMNVLVIEMARELYPEAAASGDPLAILQHPDVLPFWWALALGACLGGNGTAIGASANVVVCGIAERARHPIPFLHFSYYGIPVVVMSTLVSAVYVWLRYYVL
jgi:Na+/H+ antiporter NhaD/arsenite permease-like protein